LLGLAVALCRPSSSPFRIVSRSFRGFSYLEKRRFSLLSLLPLPLRGDLDERSFSLLRRTGFDSYTLRYIFSSGFFLKLQLTMLSKLLSYAFFYLFPE
jgi:hypothetical protein